MIGEAEFTEQYAKYADYLVRFLSGRYGREHAEDVAQQAWLNAWRYRDSFRAEANFRTWLVRIACNAALGDMRSSAGRVALGATALTAAIASSLQARYGSAEGGAVAESVLRRVRIYARMHGAEEIVRMRFVLGMSTDDVAAALNMCSNTVKVRLYRLRHELNQKCPL